ncbi:MAG: ethanolamine utilization protein EutH [Clostridia bacterium]|nr:ethanolamine utilization protein EutH [Clostridia bacterium]
MDFGQIITYIMLFFALIGALDRCIGCKFGPGKTFEQGFETMGPLALAMIGLNTVAPLISNYISPVLSPVCQALGIDPSFIAGLLLANDCGGWPLALALGQDELVAKFMGSIVGSIMGCTVTFTVPFCFSATAAEKRTSVAKGLIIGLITVPVGCFAGGLFMGINPLTLIINLLPLIILSLAFIAGLKFAEKVTVKIVTVFGYIITAVITVSLAIAMVIKVMGLNAPLFTPFDESLMVIGNIAIVLCGAFTMLFFVNKLFRKSFGKIGKKLGISETSVMGIVTTAVNSIPSFGMMKDMEEKGVVINTAFAVCGSFMLGDHLAYVASTDASISLPLILGKLIGGVFALIIAFIVTKDKKEKSE